MSTLPQTYRTIRQIEQTNERRERNRLNLVVGILIAASIVVLSHAL